MKSTVLASSIAIAAGQQAGSLQAENHPALTWTDHGESKNGKVVIDANWRWTHKTGETTNCYTDNEWDAQLCPDKETCTQNCVVEGADAEYEATYGVHTSGSELQLDFITEGEYSTNIGSRTFFDGRRLRLQAFPVEEQGVHLHRR
jgi:cellulose 1,4-beta-cellobiosidase